MKKFNIKLTYTQARRAATSLAVRVNVLDAERNDRWWELPSQDPLTESDKRYRAELLDAYDAIMGQLSKTSQL